MPPLRRAVLGTVHLPPRTAEVAADCDVLVVGAGPAGIGAAVGAARAGASVVLAERFGFVGGNATAALVGPWASFHTEHPASPEPGTAPLVPTDRGGGDAVIAGVNRTIVDRLVDSRGAIRPSAETGFTSPFDPEVFKAVALDVLDEAEVDYLFHSLATVVLGDGRVEGVSFETKSGAVAVRARVTVDCTGDGDVSALAGAEFEIGRAEDGLTQPMTLMALVARFGREAFAAYVREHPRQWRGVLGLWELIAEAAEAGDLKMPREDVLFFETPHADVVSLNSTRVTRALGIDVWDLTRAEWESRRQLRDIAAFLVKYVPGFEEAYVQQTGHVGVRETRRILGEYVLTAEDVLSARRFDDAIARNAYPMDIHNPVGSGTLLRRVPEGDAYDIPLRCLIPRRVDGLLVGGRCLSSTHEAMSSARVMPCSMATGQAAGACAAIAARNETAPREVDPGEVQTELVRQGADLRHEVGI